ncbi:hypothetical protein TNCV_2538031 [Trichonephila clavipes]|nr:hypothetical protein TNCV_2538031 [Trichonephila clavipes]
MRATKRHPRASQTRLVIDLPATLAELFHAQDKNPQYEPLMGLHYQHVARNHPILSWYKGTHKHPECHIYKFTLFFPLEKIWRYVRPPKVIPPQTQTLPDTCPSFLKMCHE